MKSLQLLRTTTTAVFLLMAGMTIAMSHAPADEVLAQSNDGNGEHCDT